MTTITFDTLRFSEVLRTTGFSEEQAKGMASALREVQESGLKEMASKRDLQETELRLKIELIRWIVGVAAGQAALIIAVLRMFPSH
ncbi:MAG: hypothetical protein HW380_3431 [Magnetococcales bacterium]|nr:hypothetical protein [Magnetococcales bacterium]HIJ84921.1 DUF1640 domain-containing protein [Magnetococcales bacterium]